MERSLHTPEPARPAPARRVPSSGPSRPEPAGARWISAAAPAAAGGAAQAVAAGPLNTWAGPDPRAVAANGRTAVRWSVGD